MQRGADVLVRFAEISKEEGSYLVGDMMAEEITDKIDSSSKNKEERGRRGLKRARRLQREHEAESEVDNTSDKADALR